MDSAVPDLANLSMTQLNSLNNQIGTGNGNIYTAAINAIESHGKGDTSNITNPSSGASGSMQTMDATLKDPGYGVKPWDGTVADKARAGRDYYNALNQHFGDPNLAAIAYNWGPGNAQKWAANGGNINQLPLETLKYLNDFDQHVTDFGGNTNAPQDNPAQSAPAQPVATQIGPPSAKGVPPPPVATGSSGSAAPIKTSYTSMADFNSNLGLGPQGQQPANAPGAQSDVNPGTAFLAGARQSVLNKVYGAQKLTGMAAESLNPGEGQPDIDAANQQLKQVQQQGQQSGANTGWGKAGSIAADVVPYILAPETIPAQAALGGAMGATEAASQGEDIGKGLLLGGVTGGAGPIVGKGIGAAGGAVKGLLSKGAGAIGDPVDQAAAHIAGGLAADGQTVPDTVAALRAGANSPVAGVERTAAEAANSPTLQAMTDAVSKTDAGKAAFDGSTEAANDAARATHLDNVTDTGLPQETADLAKSQTALDAQVPNELKPLDADFAANNIAGRPGFTQGIKDASTVADQELGEAANPFREAGEAAHGDLTNQINDVIGTPQQLDAMKAARSSEAAQKYGNITGYIPTTDSYLKQLFNRPMFHQAWENGLDDLANFNNGVRPQAIRPAQPIPGQLWQPKNEVSIQALQAAYSDLNNTISNLARNPAAASDMAQAMRIKNILKNALESNSGEFNEANKAWAAASGPIDRMQVLQQKLATAIDPTTGQVRPGKLTGAVDYVKQQWAQQYLTKADNVTQADIDALSNIASKAKTANLDVSNLSAEGQTRLLSALEQNAEKGKVGAADALRSFKNYLRAQSPSYMARDNAAANAAPYLSARQAQQDALGAAKDKISNMVANGQSLNARNVQQALGDLVNHPGQVGDAARSLLDDLRSGGVSGKGATGSVPQYGGAIGQGISHGAESAGIMSMIMHPHTIPHAVAGMIGGKILARGQGRLENAMADLLSHGNANKLADALERVGQKPTVASRAATGWNNPGLLSSLASATVGAQGAR